MKLIAKASDCTGTLQLCQMETETRACARLRDHALSPAADVRAFFCFEQCDRVQNVRIGDEAINTCSAEQAIAAMRVAVVKHE